MNSINIGLLWGGFIFFILAMLALDLWVLGGRLMHEVTIKESILWTLTWIVIALLFNLFLWIYLKLNISDVIANQKALEFFTGYLLEKSLSIDNIFVFIMIFHYFSVPLAYQKRVLTYGILGAIILRFVMIIIGVWLIHKFKWIFYIFGIFLIFTGLQMTLFGEKELKVEKNFLVVLFKKYARVTDEFHKDKFIITKNGKWFFTPLFLVLLLIEFSDAIFALDSIPAIFGVTRDAFIVFSSNIFAILGLRSLYFSMANIARRFSLLSYGIGILLMFIGVKMLLEEIYKIPIYITLIAIVSIILTSILLSIFYKKK